MLNLLSWQHVLKKTMDIIFKNISPCYQRQPSTYYRLDSQTSLCQEILLLFPYSFNEQFSLFQLILHISFVFMAIAGQANQWILLLSCWVWQSPTHMDYTLWLPHRALCLLPYQDQHFPTDGYCCTTEEGFSYWYLFLEPLDGKSLKWPVTESIRGIESMGVPWWSSG